MTTRADIYCMIPATAGGFALAKTRMVQDGTVRSVNRDLLKTMKRNDPTLHFCSFAFLANESRGQEEGRTVKHLLPIGIWGSLRTDEYVYMILGGADFKTFEFEMLQQERLGWVLAMDGAISMGHENAKPWHEELQVVTAKAEGGAQ